MKRSEEAIDRVLEALREVEAPQGIERRVLARVEEEELCRGRVGGRSGAGAKWWLPKGGVLAAVLLVLVGVGWVRWWQHGGRSAGTVVAPARQDGGAAAPVTERADGAGESGPVSSLEPVATSAVVDRARGQGMVVKGMSEAADEMLAPSLVAPALPLTKEERLLQRAAQRGGADEMAALTEAERAREGAASRAEFREFFGPARSEIGELNGKREGDGDARN